MEREKTALSALIGQKNNTYTAILDLDRFSVCMVEGREKDTEGSLFPGEEVSREKSGRLLEDIAASPVCEGTDARAVYQALFASGGKKSGVLKRYILSDRLQDGILFRVGERAFHCGDAERLLQGARERIGEMAGYVTEYCKTRRIDENEIGILCLGENAELYLFDRYLREALSLAPLLPDPRFFTYSGEVEDDLGPRISREERELFLMLMPGGQPAGGAERHRLDPEDPGTFVGPVFVGAGEKIKLVWGGVPFEVELPYPMGALDSDLVELSLYREEGRQYLRMRRYLHPTRIYDILLEDPDRRASGEV